VGNKFDKVQGNIAPFLSRCAYSYYSKSTTNRIQPHPTLTVSICCRWSKSCRRCFFSPNTTSRSLVMLITLVLMLWLLCLQRMWT